jgi:hypothetical protein
MRTPGLPLSSGSHSYNTGRAPGQSRAVSVVEVLEQIRLQELHKLACTD